MYFEPDGIYHIYNQGNNRQPVFFSNENYKFFLRKIRVHILPFADILAWCLMPNHFHLMVEVRDPVSRGAASRGATADISRGATLSRTPTREPNPGATLSPTPTMEPNLGVTLSCTPTREPNPGATLSRIPSDEPTPVHEETGQSFNHSIGVLLSSYTKAIHKQNKTTGSLFRQKTKAICLNEIRGMSSHWYTSFGVTFMKIDIPEYQYPQVCFNYIHQNPVKAKLVARAEDWEYSSYKDLIGMRAGNLVNRERVEKLGLIV